MRMFCTVPPLLVPTELYARPIAEALIKLIRGVCVMKVSKSSIHYIFYVAAVGFKVGYFCPTRLVNEWRWIINPNGTTNVGRMTKGHSGSTAVGIVDAPKIA